MAGMQLQKRERIMVTVGVLAVVGVLAYHITQGPLEAYQQVQQEYEEARFSLSQAALWRSEIVQARSSHDALAEYIEARGGNFNLLTFINNTLSEHGLIERADFSNARPGVGGVPAGDFEGVQLHLSGVSMEELIDFLHTLYDSGNLILLSDLRYLRPADDGRGLETEMTVFCPRG